MATYASAYSSYKHQPQSSASASSRPSYPPVGQQQQQQQQPQSSSSGWMQPPYPGAPPMPAGVSINPQQWQSGYWQFNPAYNRNRNSNQQHVPWIPSHHWMPQGSNQQPHTSASQQQPAQQVSHNPYKRVPRPPSAEYLATQLVDNPLGLSGLDEPNKYYDKVQTPWVWRPRDLDDEEDDGSPTSDTSPNASRKNSDNTRERDENGQYTSRRELQTTFSTNIVRTPDHYRRNSIGSLDNSSPSRTPSRTSRSSMESALSGRMSQLSVGSGSGSIPKSSSPNPLSRQSSMPTTSSSSSSFSSISPTKPDFSTAPAPTFLGDQLSDEPASMLSPLIISQTPKVGSSPLRSLRNNYTHPLIPSALDPIPESNQKFPNPNTNGTPSKSSKDRRPAPVGHSSSMPVIPSQPYYPHRRESLDQDCDWDRERSRDGRERERERDRDWDRERDRERERDHPGLGSRHTTIIDPYANPLHRSSSPSTSSPHGLSSRSSSRQSSRPSSAHASPTYSSRHASPTYIPGDPSPNRPSPPQVPAAASSTRSPPSSSDMYHHHSSLSTSSVRTITSPPPPGPDVSPHTHRGISASASTSTSASASSNPTPSSNPLPPPPQPMHLPGSRYTSTYTSPPAQLSSPPPHPPQPYDHRIRRGFWNRRGDHLTQQGYIVYAPQHLSFPPELRNYPATDEGYQNEDGVFTTYLTRPELPESLPRYGKAPEMPYESFIDHVYR